MLIVLTLLFMLAAVVAVCSAVCDSYSSRPTHKDSWIDRK
jgi:Na+-transporting methylmalonyl-CoA/oxaloacetate decarboxylase gamma subunit